MIRPGLAFALWLAIALFIVLNNAVGDTWIGATLGVRAVEWYKVLVPLPYVAMLALIHARRTAGPRWFEAALLAALLWPISTVLVDFLYARLPLRRRSRRFPRPLRLLVGRALSAAGPGPVRLSRHRRRNARAPLAQGQRASGGRDIRIASTLPPVIRPNLVPRSCSRLNST